MLVFKGPCLRIYVGLGLGIIKRARTLLRSVLFCIVSRFEGGSTSFHHDHKKAYSGEKNLGSMLNHNVQLVLHVKKVYCGKACKTTRAKKVL